MRRAACGGCGAQQFDQFLDLGASPVADAYTAEPYDPVERYPLQVAVCGKCHLVQLLEVLPAGVLFGTGYSFYSSASAPLSAYHSVYATALHVRHRALIRRGVVELGSNDGDMLRHFTAYPHLGVDPSPGPALAAMNRGCDVMVEPFSLAVARRIRDERGPQGLVIANHVLAHVEDVSDFLAGAAHLVDGGGVVMVEVQYLPDMLVNNAFDLVYHEHRNFFSLSSLEQAAARHGLHVLDVELTDRQGGSLRVTLARHGARSPRVADLRASESWLNSWSAYDGMQGRAERIRVRLLDLIGEQASVAAYGAPAKLTTLLAFCGLDRPAIRWCVDTTPAKQGRFIPGTGIPIVHPDDAPRPGAYLLSAWNYARTIVDANPGRRWIVPIPAPVLW